jgi:hypothetical protein
MPNDVLFPTSMHRLQGLYAPSVGLLMANFKTFEGQLYDCFDATVGQSRCKSPTVAETVRLFL